MLRHSLSTILLFYALVIALFLTAGCADDLRNRSLFDGGAGSAVIVFSVENVTLTREADSQDMESVVDHAYLLFYAEDASLETGVPVAAVRAEVDAADPGKLKFKMPLRLQPNTDYQLLAVANADLYVPSGFIDFGDYIDSWCKNSLETDHSSMLLYRTARITPELVTALPMSGGVAGKSVFRFSLENGAYNVSASLSFRRNVARIDVANIVKEGFNVEGVMLCNWRDAVTPFSQDASFGNRLGAVHGVLSEEGAADDMFIQMPEADDSGIQRLNKMIYCFPSISYDSYPGDRESTALIIKAKYGADAQSTYYRVNVGLNGNVSEVKANTKYLVTIQSVKGSGAPTPEEAYIASESPIILSVVEDWDLDGSNFAMDEYGNFIVVSSSKLEFDSDDVENREVKVLTSKGLSWTLAYIPDNEASSDAFRFTRISDSSFVVSPVRENTEETTLSGKCVVSALTSKGNHLSVSISATHHPLPEEPYVPVIPDLDYSIIPLNGKRVKINHDSNPKTIEIDAFDPDCFNSFIDIPFKVYVNPNFTETPISIYSTLQWPSEGAVSMTRHEDYTYCSESFSSIVGNVRVYSKKDDKLFKPQIGVYGNGIQIKDGDTVYISVGAMAPDDPAIVRKVVLLCWGREIEYELTVRTRPAIIDDVVLSDPNGQHWLIFDRNIQDLSNSNFHSYIGIKSDGSKYQAYNYLSQYPAVNIPFKYKYEGTVSDEGQHSLYLGYMTYFRDREKLQLENPANNATSRYSWLRKYESVDGQNCTSPFYDSSIYDKWNFPGVDILKLCAAKMRVSKLRMFLVSEVPAKDGKNNIPVCCYWPYYGDAMDRLSSYEYTYGYFASDETGTPASLVFVYCDKTEMKSETIQNDKYSGLSRLVRPLTKDELENYKTNYLGYGSQPHKLIICHPDTYGFDGWISY